MSNYNLMFNIRYTFHLETMQATLCGRIDRGMSIGQIFLGAMCAGFVELAPYIGAIIALLSAVSLVCQFGAKAVRAEQQARNVKALLAFDGDETELKQRFMAIQDNDSEVFGALRNAAHIRASIALGVPDSHQLTGLEKLCSFLAGDLPTHS
ncbi:hypothetical protein [Pseudaeromonas pectinilytica]